MFVNIQSLIGSLQHFLIVLRGKTKCPFLLEHNIKPFIEIGKRTNPTSHSANVSRMLLNGSRSPNLAPIPEAPRTLVDGCCCIALVFRTPPFGCSIVGAFPATVSVSQFPGIAKFLCTKFGSDELTLDVLPVQDEKTTKFEFLWASSSRFPLASNVVSTLAFSVWFRSAQQNVGEPEHLNK